MNMGLLRIFAYCGYDQEEKNNSGREDLNLRPLDPQSSALTGLRHAPKTDAYYKNAPPV